MPNLALSAHAATMLALVLAACSIELRLLPARRWTGLVSAAAWEIALVLGLFALWQLGGDLARTRVVGGISHGYAVWHAERIAHLPSEVVVQGWFLPHHTLIHLADWYYAGVHLNTMWIFLVWLWLRHRDAYPRWRNIVVLSTGFCLLVQMVPVAPPRFLDSIGIVDTPLLYGESVYGAFGRSVAQQLSAMPSVHVGWAVLIAWAVIAESTSRWRWLILLHTALTVLVVTITGNHYWFDGLAAAALVVLAAVVERGRAAAGAAVRARVPTRWHPAAAGSGRRQPA